MGARLRYSGPPRALARVRPSDKAERDRFYAGAAWRKLRAAFLAESPLCARCLERGRAVAARIVHHRIERLEDPEKALDWDNLEALCDPCHTTHHNATRKAP